MTPLQACELIEGGEAPPDLIGEITGTRPEAPAASAAAPIAGDVVRFEHSGGCFYIRPDGVYFARAKEGGEADESWICGPLRLLAKTRDARGHAWGRLLEWKDADGLTHRWAMPCELLQGDGLEVFRELSRQGLEIAPSPGAKMKLAAYLQAFPTDERATCAERLGWHGGVFVTPGEPIGQAGEEVVFQNGHGLESAMGQAGTVEGWRDAVAALASGNSRLAFAVSVAFAAPLAALAGEDSGGFHLRGASSSGKSTALKVAASVWGDPMRYPRQWRTTTNGLEGLAALHNDGLLILDELGQIDAKDVGEAAYLLANGQGKARATRNGTARAPARWRLFFLSAGEVSLGGHMASEGKRANAGQEIRLADIAADAGAGLGTFENLHGRNGGAAFALAVMEAASRQFGAVGLAWLRRVVAERERLAEALRGQVDAFAAANVPKGASGQVERVARRFGLVAAAGELATAWGLTGWTEGEAREAAGKCFASWLEGFGAVGNREERALLDQVRAFFEAHGASRFESLEPGAPHEQKVIHRAGFVRTTLEGEREYLVFAEAFKSDICRGYGEKAAGKVLRAAGWLRPAADGRSTRPETVPGIKRGRFYVFLTSRMWEDAE